MSVTGTALVQNHGRYEASPHAHTHILAFLIGVWTEMLGWSAEPVWWLQLALDAFEHHLLESMRASDQPSMPVQTPIRNARK